MNAACDQDSKTQFEMHRFGGPIATGETFELEAMSNLRHAWQTPSIPLKGKEHHKLDSEGAVLEALKKPRLAGTRHFHLLGDEDLDEMRGLLETMRDRRAEVVARWYELYARHFGEGCNLGESEFASIFEPAIVAAAGGPSGKEHGPLCRRRHPSQRSPGRAWGSILRAQRIASVV